MSASGGGCDEARWGGRRLGSDGERASRPSIKSRETVVERGGRGGRGRTKEARVPGETGGRGSLRGPRGLSGLSGLCLWRGSSDATASYGGGSREQEERWEREEEVEVLERRLGLQSVGVGQLGSESASASASVSGLERVERMLQGRGPCALRGRLEKEGRGERSSWGEDGMVVEVGEDKQVGGEEEEEEREAVQTTCSGDDGFTQEAHLSGSTTADTSLDADGNDGRPPKISTGHLSVPR